ncbi:MAG: hypothetical protein H7Y38_12540 [Armatimonadetes bacterium]|nr:hypothetical protein [Armatimonadota bacterium]
MPEPSPPAPVVYCSDLSADRFDPADLFDVAYLLSSPAKLSLQAIVLPEGDDNARALDVLAARIPNAPNLSVVSGAEGIAGVLRGASEPANVVAVANVAPLAELLRSDRALFREKVARLFLVGGHANDYALPHTEGERLPIDPRLQERHPERFARSGDSRQSDAERKAFGELLTSGEGVIWLPRDICLWRYAAPQILSDGGAVCELLLRELFFANLQTMPDRFAAGDAPVLLSALPAFLLATQTDPLGWLRLFRTVTVRVETDADTGTVTGLAAKHERPNAYAVVGMDGAALGKVLTQSLRTRPLIP